MAQASSPCPTAQRQGTSCHPKSLPIGAPGFDNHRPDLQYDLAFLQQQVNNVLAQQKRLEGKIDKLVPTIWHIRDTLSDSERRSTIPFAVFNFVAAIERANLYFGFKDAAKKEHAPGLRKSPKLLPEILHLLRHCKTLQSKFHNIGEQELRQAATAIFCELSDERLLKQQDAFQKREDPALRHPIYDLVFRARHQAIVMDQEPELELEKIMKSDPCFYDGNLRPKVPPVVYATTSVEARNSYAKFWSKYVKSANDAEPCVENVEDAGSVLPLLETDLSYVLQTGSREEFGLKKKLQALDGKMSELLQKQKELEEKLTDLLVQSTERRNTFFEWRMRSALPSAVIHFVAAIEKANLYFDFKNAAMDRHRPELLKTPKVPSKIFDTLRKDETLMLKFNKIGEVGFRQAAMAIFVELGDERRREREVKHTEELQKCGFKKREDPALAHSINRLVYQTREQEIVMDQNPIIELEKIMISDPGIYNSCFNLGEKPVDGLATPEAAQIKYSEFWSKYVNAAKHAEPALEMASMLDNMGITVNQPTTNAPRVVETNIFCCSTDTPVQTVLTVMEVSTTT